MADYPPARRKRHPVNFAPVQQDSNLIKNITGGAVAAALTLPVGISLGIVTLEPLGGHLAPLGVAAGVYGVMLCSLLPVLFGSRGGIINVPRSVAAVFVAGLVIEASAAHRMVMRSVAPEQFLYAMVFLFLALTGIFQALIGLLRLGTLVKYLPHSVLAGFMNAVAVLLAIAQLPAILGMPPGSTPADIVVVPSKVNLGSVVVALATLGALRLPQMGTVRFPPLILGLIVGTVVHHLIKLAGFGHALGPILGEAGVLYPRFDTALGFRELIESPVFFAQALPALAAAAFGLALISSLDTLLLMRTFERMTHERLDSQRELTRLGISNTIAACVGAIPSSMSLAASQSNYSTGGRNGGSVVAHCVIVLVAILLLHPVIAAIPRSVVAALLLSISLIVIDKPTINTIRKLLGGKVRNRGRLAMDVLVMLTVFSIAMLASVALAVVAGVLIAVLSFLVNMSHSVVRNVTRGDAMRSRRSRGVEHTAILARVGRRIAVIEIEGVIFFGTADDLLMRIEQCLKEGATHIIVDLGRVVDVDTTGAQMLIQIHERVKARGGMLIVSQAAPGQPQWDFMVDVGVVAALGTSAFTPDTDRALELAENSLIAAEGVDTVQRTEIALRGLLPFARLDNEEFEVLAPLLSRRTFSKGEFVFREGDPGTDLYVIAMGTASVRREEGTRSTRLVTFGEGTIFGEMALLDAKPRSASVQADGPLVCFVMARDVFDQMAEQHRSIALKLLMSLSQELGRRLRLTNDIVEKLQA